MFRHLDYQDRVLSALDAYVDALKEKKARADRIVALAVREPDLALAIPDFAMEAWETLKAEAKLPASRAAIPSCAKTRPFRNRPQISSLDALGIRAESRVFRAAGLTSDPWAGG